MAEDGRWHLEKSWDRAGNGKSQFPSARGPKIKRNVATVPRMGFRNFLTLYGLPDRTPRGGKSQHGGASGRFGPGQPLALRETSRARAEDGKPRFPGARGREIEKQITGGGKFRTG